MVTVQLLVQQQLRHRLADDVGAADDDGALAREIAEAVLQQHEAAERRARHQALAAGREPPGIDDMEAVDILGRIDGVEDRLGIDLLRQRQLDEDAVDRRGPC